MLELPDDLLYSFHGFVNFGDGSIYFLILLAISCPALLVAIAFPIVADSRQHDVLVMREVVPSVPIPMRITINSVTWGGVPQGVHHIEVPCLELLPSIGERIRLVDDHGVARTYMVATSSREYNLESGLCCFCVHVSSVK